MADDEIAAREEQRLRDIALDAHIRRYWPEIGRVVVTTDGDDQIQRLVGQSVDESPYDRRPGVEERSRAEGQIDGRLRGQAAAPGG